LAGLAVTEDQQARRLVRTKVPGQMVKDRVVVTRAAVDIRDRDRAATRGRIPVAIKGRTPVVTKARILGATRGRTPVVTRGRTPVVTKARIQGAIKARIPVAIRDRIPVAIKGRDLAGIRVTIPKGRGPVVTKEAVATKGNDLLVAAGIRDSVLQVRADHLPAVMAPGLVVTRVHDRDTVRDRAAPADQAEDQEGPADLADRAQPPQALKRRQVQSAL